MSFFGAMGAAPRRLFVFPHAGGSDQEARAWRAPPGLDVHAAVLPGRGRRASERPYRAMEPLVEDLADTLPTDRPFVFYGHSFGALVAFALARELRTRGLSGPTALIVGARGAPHVPEALPLLSRLDQAAFLEEADRRWGGIPDGLRAHPDLLALFLKAVRADVLVLERWAPADEPPLDVPIVAVHAHDDPSVPADAVAAWREHTTGAFAVHTVSGGHFFHREHAPFGWLP